MWEPFFQSVLSASSAISSSKGERRAGRGNVEAGKGGEETGVEKETEPRGIKHTRVDVERFSSCLLFRRGLKKDWRWFSGGLQPSRLEVSARRRWMVWRDSARLCETITGEIWGPADLPFVLYCLSASPSLLFSLSLSLALFLVPRPSYDASHCSVLHPFISRDTVVSVSPVSVSRVWHRWHLIVRTSRD